MQYRLLQRARSPSITWAMLARQDFLFFVSSPTQFGGALRHTQCPSLICDHAAAISSAAVLPKHVHFYFQAFLYVGTIAYYKHIAFKGQVLCSFSRKV